VPVLFNEHRRVLVTWMKIKHTVVTNLPDLIFPEEYDEHPRGGLVRLRLTPTSDGVEVLGDAFRPDVLEEVLSALGPDDIQQMLCG
jgi:FtsH ternary system-associated peptide